MAYEHVKPAFLTTKELLEATSASQRRLNLYFHNVYNDNIKVKNPAHLNRTLSIFIVTELMINRYLPQ